MVFKSSLNNGNSGGITSLNGEIGDVTLTSAGNTVTITTPTPSTINLEAAGGGTVTSVAGTDANGISFSIANPTTTPNITISLGAIVPSAVNGLTLAAQAVGFTIAGGTTSKTLTVPLDASVSGTNTGDQTTSGTANRISVSNGSTNPIINISASYSGQSTITTLGTIGTGAWQGTKINLLYGGTNADLSGTGGASQVLKQISAGAAITVGQLAASDLSNGTTGSGAIVLASAPTMTNPVVGTQSAGDNSTKGASTAYVTSAIATAIAGVNPAVAVQAATTSASDTSGLTYNNGVSGIGATLTGPVNTVLTVDGYTFTALGQRLLVKNDTQSPSGAFNGVYYVTQVQTALLPLILTRALDYDMPSDINNTGAIPVVNGTVNGTTSWVLTSQITTVGTDPLTYVQFSINPTTILTNTLTNTHIFIGNSSNVATDVALSGDLTITNTGTTTLATVNSNVGSFGSSTSIPNLTVNGKGLITAAGGNAVVAPAGTLTGTTIGSTVVTSSLTTVGTLVNLTVTNPISGSVTGNAGTVTIGSENADTTCFPLFATAATGSLSPKSSASFTFDASITNLTSVTFTGALSGNASTAAALQTGRTINGITFDGTANIVAPAAAGTLTGTTIGSTVVTSSLTTVGTLTNLTVTNPIAGSVTGSASSATTAAAGTLTGTTLGSTVVTSFLTSFGASIALGTPASGVATNLSGTALALNAGSAPAATLTGTTIGSTVVVSSLTKLGTLGSLTVTSTIIGSVNGSAATLTTPRAINGVNFDGSAAITIPSAAGTLTGTTIGSTVVTSSLTTVGTLTGLTVTGTTNVGGINISSLTASAAVATDASKNLLSITNTGTGNNVLATSPTLSGTSVVNSMTVTNLNFGGSVLNNYTESTYTPTINFGGLSNGITYTRQLGTYTRIGRETIAHIDVRLSNKGSSTGVAFITLPTSPSSFNYGVSILATNLTGTTGGIMAYIASGGSQIQLIYSGTGAGSDVTDANFTNTATLIMTAIYFT